MGELLLCSHRHLLLLLCFSLLICLLHPCALNALLRMWTPLSETTTCEKLLPLQNLDVTVGSASMTLKRLKLGKKTWRRISHLTSLRAAKSSTTTTQCCHLPGKMDSALAITPSEKVHDDQECCCRCWSVALCSWSTPAYTDRQTWVLMHKCRMS